MIFAKKRQPGPFGKDPENICKGENASQEELFHLDFLYGSLGKEHPVDRPGLCLGDLESCS